MNPPAPDAAHAERVADTLELLAKAGGVLGMLWAFMVRVLRPYQERKRANLVRTIREAMAPIMEPFHEDHDLLLEIALDNRARHDETNDLLDALGFTTDRRSTSERRQEIADMVNTLTERRRARRRSPD